ncbi:MAG: homoserine dehydrogenase [Deltaproteobacteria bacterium]|nr:homoserine dehydrogenase [Deltaproteobacteria bacterium]
MAKKKEVKTAIVGLGKVGSTFLKKLLEKERQGIKVICVAEQTQDTPGIKLAKDKGIKIYNSPEDLLSPGEELDIIFDLTGNPNARKALRSGLARTGNLHTVIAPEVVAYLVWDLIAQGEEFPESGAKRGY